MVHLHALKQNTHKLNLNNEIKQGSSLVNEVNSLETKK